MPMASVPAVADGLDDPRQSGKLRHALPAVVRQRLFGLIASHANPNDHTRLRHDAILQTVTAETFIDEFKNGLFRDRLGCRRFVPNTRM